MNEVLQQIPPEVQGKIVGWLLSLLSRLNPKSWFRRKPETIHLHMERSGWNMGTIASEPAMQVNCHWRVTNDSDRPIELWDARVRLPMNFRKHQLHYQHIFVRHPHGDVYSSRHPILAHATSEASMGFWIVPPCKEVGEDLKVTVQLVDQYGHVHRKQRVRVPGLVPATPDAEPIPEPIHSLGSQLEKDLVSVLKSEITRYRANGRIRGGLGSFTIVATGRRMESGFADWRREGIGTEQSIVQNPEQVQIESDNFSRLRRLYDRLSTDDERSKFKGMLLRRLSSETEYAPIAYLIVWFFLDIGELKDCLDKAKGSLSASTKFPLGKYAYSDSLRLLDLLLQYQHNHFDGNRLEQLEASLEGVTEHTFRIHERIAAIRASRLM